MRALIFIVVVFCSCTLLKAQEYTPVSHKVLDSLITIEDFDQVDKIIKKNIQHYNTKGPLDSLAEYPVYIGKVAIVKDGKAAAERKVISFISEIEKRTKNPRILFKTYLSLDRLYLDLADNEGAKKAAITALEYAQQTTDVTYEELGRIHYILGGDYYALYDDPNSLKHFKESIFYYEKSKTVAKHTLADSYNGAAIGMWVLNQLDNAEEYYKKAIQLAENSDLKGYDKNYYIAMFKFNLALIIDDQGRVNDAIALEKSILKIFQEIKANSNDVELVEKAKKLEAGVIANLAAFYNDIGYVDKAYEMIKYSYEKKKKLYDDTDLNLITELDKIAGVEVSLRHFDRGIETVELALKNMKNGTDAYPAMEANLYHTKAMAYQGKEDIPLAQHFFEKSEILFQKAYPIDYGRRYLFLLRNYAQFLIINGKKEAAFSKAENAFAYISKNTEKENIAYIKELLGLAEVYFQGGIYNKSLTLAKEGNSILDTKLKKATTTLDSIQIEYRRPSITYLEVASNYELEENKTVNFLKSQIATLDKAVNALEQRRSTSIAKGDLLTLREEYSKLNKLSKKIHYEQYLQTKDSQLLDKLLTLQESSVYHQIRTQLNSREEIGFNKVPDTILKQELAFKKVLSLDDKGNNYNITTYLEKQQTWEEFLQFLKEKYPDYYKMKYASLEVPITNLQKQIPENTTVLRYLFLEDELFVILISAKTKELIKLPATNLKLQISQLTKNWQDPIKTGAIAHQLYQKVWEPFDKKITTNNIIIIPDGDLYNLSFEMLTTTAITSFDEFASRSLLNKYSISYNFSSLFIDANKNPTHFAKNYVGFAPEFTSDMKDGYFLTIKDSLIEDKTYLTLLPQPFITEVTNKYSRQFNGSSFINEKASKSVFLDNAQEHKIIHIGTHAESNNVYPELSRLIFAKELESNSDELSTDENSLYTYEIYNTNLSANLAILTACETGKPEYQAGEGMISLAHAFTYAGSESILTSLWQIDEQTSAKIVGLFFDNLKEGMQKDQALQKAKLTYLSTAKGRTVAPQYWAGLVLIGDTSPIDIKTTSYLWLIISGVFIILFTIFLLLKFAKQKKQATKNL